LQQRIKALNLFIQDIYKQIKDKIIPKEMILSSVSYLKELQGLNLQKICHITGSDLIKEEGRTVCARR
jgi:uncharacterized circularly permuted ATP-grasp superfamily protein